MIEGMKMLMMDEGEERLSGEELPPFCTLSSSS